MRAMILKVFCSNHLQIMILMEMANLLLRK